MKLIYFFLLSSCFSAAFSQARTLTEKELFESGMASYRSGAYSASMETFESMTATFPEGHLYTSGLLMLSKTYGQMQYFRKSISLADKLISAYPGSTYVDEALYMRAQNYYRMSDYASSIADLARLVERSSQKKYKILADSIISLIIQSNLSSAEIKSMLTIEKKGKLGEVLRQQYVSNLLVQNRYGRARTFIESVIAGAPASFHIKSYREMLRQIDKKEEGPVRIGFTTSLTGSNSEIGKSIKAGVELAVHQHNLSNSPRVELIIYDDQSDIIQAIQAVKELVADERICAIIGPLESNSMAAAAVIADQRRIPIISPTATKSGLTQIGAYVYQANVNIESRSEAIARYAVEELGLKTFAIFSPSDLYGDIASTAFAKSVEALGGRMIVFEKFYDNTTDFKGQIVHLRKMGFIDRAMQQSSFRFLSKLTPSQIDSIYAQYYPIDSTSTEGEYNLPMDHIDALFLPVYTDEIKYIAPQLAFYNIKTQLLGGDNWYDLTELKLHHNYVNDVLFVSESFMDPNKSEVKSFYEKFKQLHGTMPTRDAVYGFDLMSLLASIVQSGHYTSEEFQVELRRGFEWRGIHNKIIFTKNSRVNSSVHILQFSDGQIKKQSE